MQPGKKPLLVNKRTGTNTSRHTVTVRCRNSYTKHALHRHSVAAITPILEEATGTLPLTIIKCGGMNIIFTVELDLKARKLDALRLFSVALGFCNFVDH